MPPKKDVAATKGVKGKAKAAAKEQKKQEKLAKVSAKGKSRAPTFALSHHSLASLVWILRFFERVCGI